MKYSLRIRGLCGSRKRRGAVIVLVAVSLIAIFGLAALAVDSGRMFRERRNAQAAADMAAESAGIELFVNYPQRGGKDSDGAARNAALEVAANNGYENSLVRVNIPPSSGAFAGRDGCAEVIISSHLPRSFSNIFGIGNLAVKARAVAAGTMRASKASVMVLEPIRKDALRFRGKSSTLKVAGDVIVNSTAKRAVKLDKRSQIQAENLLVAGGLDKQVKGLIDAEVSTNVAPTPDPLSALPRPLKGTPLSANDFKTSYEKQDVYELPPGNYSDLIFDTNDDVYLNPGVYYIDGEISFKDSSSISGDKVMIYTAAKKGIKFHSTGTVNLSPPISGNYKGIVLFQDGSTKTRIEFRKESNLGLSGILYAPNSEVIFRDSDLEMDENWEAESDSYVSADDAGITSSGGLNASIICRKLTIGQGSLIELRGADIDSQKPLRGLVE